MDLKKLFYKSYQLPKVIKVCIIAIILCPTFISRDSVKINFRITEGTVFYMDSYVTGSFLIAFNPEGRYMFVWREHLFVAYYYGSWTEDEFGVYTTYSEYGLINEKQFKEGTYKNYQYLVTNEFPGKSIGKNEKEIRESIDKMEENGYYQHFYGKIDGEQFIKEIGGCQPFVYIDRSAEIPCGRY